MKKSYWIVGTIGVCFLFLGIIVNFLLSFGASRAADRFLVRLSVTDTTGRPIRPDTAPVWVRDAARATSTTLTRQFTKEVPDEIQLRLHAQRFLLASGIPMVAVAVADQVELEDRYAALIAAFGVSALAAIVLVAIGGSFLVQQSLLPIERSMTHMRRFMADAAHEMRTPLTVIRSRAEVALQQARSPDEYVESMQGVEAETRRLGRIVDDLLMLARADAGEQPTKLARLFLDDVVSDAVGAARAMAAARHVELVIDQFEEAPVLGDGGLLYQLTMLLLDNATKFTPAGGRVSVRVGVADERTTLIVEDTGIGIDAEELPHIFERFFRADPARTRSGAGSETHGAGLGLAIAKWIVEMHHALVEAQSTVGIGTRISVVFPKPDAVPMSSS